MRNGATSARVVPSPQDIIRGLVLADGGVTEAEAALLLVVLDRLQEIEDLQGRAVAVQFARRVRRAWIDGSALLLAAGEAS